MTSTVLIRGGTVVNADREQRADVLCADGVIVAVGEGFEASLMITSHCQKLKKFAVNATWLKLIEISSASAASSKRTWLNAKTRLWVSWLSVRTA